MTAPQAPLETSLKIVNKLGLHARAAAKFVQAASQFESEITLTKDKQEANGKSIMSILMLAAAKGSEITLKTNGKDQKQASKTLADLIKDGFGEK